MGEHGIVQRPDWRDRTSYDYTLTLPRIGWAWEFLRRNPELRKIAGTLPRLTRVRTTTPMLRMALLLDMPLVLGTWGVLFL